MKGGERAHPNTSETDPSLLHLLVGDAEWGALLENDRNLAACRTASANKSALDKSLGDEGEKKKKLCNVRGREAADALINSRDQRCERGKKKRNVRLATCFVRVSGIEVQHPWPLCMLRLMQARNARKTEKLFQL